MDVLFKYHGLCICSAVVRNIELKKLSLKWRAKGVELRVESSEQISQGAELEELNLEQRARGVELEVKSSENWAHP